MLYIFFGTDRHTASKKVQATVADLQKKKPDARFFQLEGTSLSVDMVREYALSQGLFESKHIVEIRYPFETAESKEVFMNNLAVLAESPSVFLVLEGAILVADKKALTKHAENITEFKKATSEKKDTAIFSLAEAVGKKDKKQSWVIFQKELAKGTQAEALHGILWWQLKSIYMVMVSRDATEVGMKEYTYNKAKALGNKYTKSELEGLLKKMIDMYHRSHKGLCDFDLELEKMILTL